MKAPTVHEIRETMLGRSGTAGLNTHHTAVQHWTEKLVPGITPQEMDEMPGLLLHRMDHLDLGPGSASFHRILGEIMPYDSTDGAVVILRDLERAYNEIGRPDVWKVTREWLRTKGVQ